MKKCLLFIVSVLLIMLTCSCISYGFDFLHSEDQITSVNIVSLSFDDNMELKQQVICEVENIDDFLERFRKINCRVYFGDPTGVIEEGTSGDVIQVKYENGEYDLINWNGQSKYTNERGLRFYAGYSIFDKQSFEELIAYSITQAGYQS